MESNAEPLSPARVRLVVKVPFDELQADVRKVCREIEGRTNLTAWRDCRIPFQDIDQRLGATALPYTVEQTVLSTIFVAAREHDVRILGRPLVDVTGFGEGQPLEFAAIVDVRPEITVPEATSLAVAVDPIVISDQEVDERIEAARLDFATFEPVDRSAAAGDVVRIDVIATAAGVVVPAIRAVDAAFDLGADVLPDGLDLDEDVVDSISLAAALRAAVTGLSAGESATVQLELADGDSDGDGRQADLIVTVNAVTQRLVPEADDGFASLAADVDTLDELRDTLRARLTRSKRHDQLVTARDLVLKEMVKAAAVPAPESLVRDEVEHRKQWMLAELDRIGTSLADHLRAQDLTEEEIDAQLFDATADRVRIRILLDAVADEERIGVAEDEYRDEIVRRAGRAGVSPQTYLDHTVRAGAADDLLSEVRRNKAMSLVLARVTARDTEGNLLDLDDRLQDPLLTS